MIVFKTDSIPVLELRKLLYQIHDLKPDTCIRFRLIGEMWHTTHMKVVKPTEKGVLLLDEVKNKMISVPDLATVVQFELDQAFLQSQPHFHYNVVLSDQKF